MPLPIEKKRAAFKAINELHRITMDMVEKAGMDSFDDIPSLHLAAAQKLTDIQNALCKHPAFAAGRCALCNKTYAECGL